VGHRAGVSEKPGKGGDRSGWPASAHEARRFILECLPGCEPVEGLPTDAERYGRGDEPAVLLVPELVEDAPFRAIQVAEPRAARGNSGFGGFLDGTQDVRIVNQLHGVPIVWATVSAAIRARVNRRLVSWAARPPIVSGRYYIPLRYVDGLREDLRAHPHVADTLRADAHGAFPSRHPAALMEAAVQRIQQDREAIELELAESWCGSEKSALYVDGSITGSGIASVSPLAVGVIKSHRRLYADGDAFRVLVGLAAGQRTSVFRVTPRGRHPVVSWYVRIRPSRGRDALFGLVRVEAADSRDISARADEISRWILAEGSPIALPDGRWDKMAYGIRDTEEFLRAIS
jgi:hypothetical protein